MERDREDGAAVDFGAVLDALRVVPSAGPVRGASLPEDQMFEGPSSSRGGESGPRAPEDGTRAPTDRIEDEAGNSTKGAARLARHGDEGGRARGAAGADTGVSRGAMATGSARSVTSVAAAQETGSPETGSAAQRGTSESAAARSSSAGGASAPSNAAVSAGETSAPPVAVSAAGAAAPSGVRATEGVARQVAELLAATKGGGAPSSPTVGAESATSQSRATAKATDRGDAASGRESSDTAPREAPGPERSTFDRLVRTIRLQGGFKQSSARMQLDPPELGRLDVEVMLTANRLRIGVRTATAEARELLRDRVAELRAALEQHGIRIERFEVSVGDESSLAGFGGGGFGPREGRQNERETGGLRRQDALAGRAESSASSVVGVMPGGSEQIVSKGRLDVRV